MHISTVCANRVAAHLGAGLAAEFQQRGWGDFHVKVGRLQDDPERPSVNLMVHVQRPHDDRWVDQPVGDRYFRAGRDLALGYEQGELFAIGEVGGGRTWLRRFTVEGSIFFTRSGEDRDQANERANIIRGLVELYLAEDLCIGLEDEFGERAHRLMLNGSSAEEKGGPRNHIWAFWVYFSVETVRP